MVLASVFLNNVCKKALVHSSFCIFLKKMSSISFGMNLFLLESISFEQWNKWISLTKLSGSHAIDLKTNANSPLCSSNECTSMKCCLLLQVIIWCSVPSTARKARATRCTSSPSVATCTRWTIPSRRGATTSWCASGGTTTSPGRPSRSRHPRQRWEGALTVPFGLCESARSLEDDRKLFVYGSGKTFLTRTHASRAWKKKQWYAVPACKKYPYNWLMSI